MGRPIRLIAPLCAAATLTLVLACAGVPAALAAGGDAVINDCESNGQLTHHYTVSQLRQALAVMPATVKQYTNCYDVINQALLKNGQLGGGSGGNGGGGGSFLPTPVIVILVVLILAGVTFGAMAIRRRRGGVDPGPGDDPPGAGGPAAGGAP
jgi:hypothetical protein